MKRRIILAVLAAAFVSSQALAVGVMGGGGGGRREPRVPGIDDTPPIQWRETYAEALAEAKKKGRPLLIFFHEANKGARMTEMGTFDDSRVKERAGRFVPVQVDVVQEEDVARKYALQISQAVVIASPEEKKLSELQGNPNFELVAKAMDEAIKVMGNPPTDAEIAQMTARLDAAQKAFDTKRYSSAHIYLKPLVKSKAKCGVIAQAKELAGKIATAGSERLAAAKGLYDARKHDEAKAECRKIAREFRGLEIEKQAVALRKTIEKDPAITKATRTAASEKSAAAFLRAAQRYERSKKYAAAMSSYGRVVGLGETSSKAKAEEALARLKADPAVAKAVAAAKAERAARSLWSRAGSWIASGKIEEAQKLLKELVEKHPDSPYAKKAKAKLKELALD